MKTLKISLIFSIVLGLNYLGFSQYLDINSVHDVSLPPHGQNSFAQIYFDLSLINTDPPLYLDLVVASNITVQISQGVYSYYKYGTWNINSGNGAFNNYNQFFNDNSNDLSDIIFIQL